MVQPKIACVIYLAWRVAFNYETIIETLGRGLVMTLNRKIELVALATAAVVIFLAYIS